MKTEIVNVTPKLAAKYLQRNTANRPIRRTVVDGIKDSFMRGEYIPSHQGIAFSSDGILLDGQHRLIAISELDSGSFPMLVSSGIDPVAFKVMDVGLKRSAADALQEDKRLIETAGVFASICNKSKLKPTPTRIIPFAERIRDIHNDLISYCGSISKTWSAVNIRAAAVLTIMNGGDSDYVKSVYRALVLTDIEAMPTSAKSLLKSYLAGAMNIRDKGDTITRCLVVFDKKRSANKQIKVFDTQVAYRLVRETFADLS